MPDLPDGLTLREATADDHEGIVAVCAEVFGDHEGAAVRHLLTGDGYGPGRWTVVTDAQGTVVSCSVLLLHVLRYGATEVPAAQVEFVATSEAVRKQGLVRAQFAVHHQWADEAGALVCFVTGIPYLYRRLGYGYGFDYAHAHRLLKGPDAPAGWVVEPATAADLDDLIRLHDQALARADLAVRGPDSSWRWLVEGAPSWEEQVLVARRDGRVRGLARLQLRPADGWAEVEGAADEVGAARALVAHAAEATGGFELFLLDRAGDPWGTVVRQAGVYDPRRFNAVYARIPDPVAFLDHVRDELSTRLAASPLRNEAGELALSFYEDGLVLTYADGEVSAVRRDPDPALDPMDDDDAGVAPDAVPALLLGRFGADALERRYDDVGYAKDRALVEVLFPKLTMDLGLPV